MIKLRKFAYKFWLPIILCIGFVFIQSQSELYEQDSYKWNSSRWI